MKILVCLLALIQVANVSLIKNWLTKLSATSLFAAPAMAGLSMCVESNSAGPFYELRIEPDSTSPFCECVAGANNAVGCIPIFHSYNEVPGYSNGAIKYNLNGWGSLGIILWTIPSAGDSPRFYVVQTPSSAR